MLACHLNGRENFLDEAHKIIRLFLGANGLLRVINFDVGGADHDAAVDGVNQDDAAVVVLKEKFVAVASGV